MLMKAAFPPYRKDRSRTCRMYVAYCSGRTGMVLHTEKRRHCREVRKRDRMDERKSASFSVSPSKHRWKEEQRKIFYGILLYLGIIMHLNKFWIWPGFSAFPLCLSINKPFQGAQSIPVSCVKANALVYRLTRCLREKKIDVKGEIYSQYGIKHTRK